MGRHDVPGAAIDKAVVLEPLQRLRQHALAEPADRAPKLAEFAALMAGKRDQPSLSNHEMERPKRGLSVPGTTRWRGRSRGTRTGSSQPSASSSRPSAPEPHERRRALD